VDRPCAVTGITSKRLRLLMIGILGSAYGVNHASYDLGLLAAAG